jgi:5-methyltetrahydrofolate--homocysteine methyltransferase
MNNKFIELLNKKDFVIFDGACGTEILKRYSGSFVISEELSFIAPEIIGSIAADYAKAGSDIICANTFSANRFKTAQIGKTVEEVFIQSVGIAREYTKSYGTLVAADVSSIGKLLEPMGAFTFDEAYDVYKEIALAAKTAGADAVIIETMSELAEIRAAVLAIKENTNLPVICSMTYEKNGRTFTGVPPAVEGICLSGLLQGITYNGNRFCDTEKSKISLPEFAPALCSADAVGVNCGIGPAELEGVVSELLANTPEHVQVMVKPNAGLPDPVTGKFSLSPAEFARHMKVFAEKGVRILGGCCGTSPEHIAELVKVIQGVKPVRAITARKSAVCSATSVKEIDRPRVIGERLNPTGKAKLKQALRENNMAYVLSLAVEQVDAGADILDVNVGLPEIDEKEMMVKIIKELQGVVDVPLQIDSTKPYVIEAALRAYSGKAIVNSVNGEENSLVNILPVVKKYGAAVIGLALDENGIPPKAEARVAIARKILERALSYGIPKEDVYIDCLVLTVAAEQSAAAETLKAVRLVKEQLGLKTCLGTSNISFGLPERDIVNRTFLV